MKDRVVSLDMRKVFRLGCEPFPKIMQAVAGLRPAEALLLIAPFEPLALFSALARVGFSHESRRTGTGTWEVLFQRVAIDRATEQSPAPHPGNGTRVIKADARGLEPSQPLVTILEVLAHLH